VITGGQAQDPHGARAEGTALSGLFERGAGKDVVGGGEEKQRIKGVRRSGVFSCGCGKRIRNVEEGVLGLEIGGVRRDQ